MKIKFCLPIIKNSKKEVLKALSTKGYDCYEVWLDYIDDLDEKFVVDIAKRLKEKLILLFRRQNLEKIKMSVEKRQQIISLLLNFNVFLDIDFLTQHEDLEYLRKRKSKTKLILSFHDYKETPKLDYLINLTSKMRRYNPDVYKYATFCQTEKETLTLLNLLLKLKEQKLKFIVLGMGKMGQITRIIGPIWGNEISFAPDNLKDISAKGQLSKKQLEAILEGVNYGR